MAQPMLNLGGNLSPEQQIQQQQIARQQKMAELLMQQGQQTPSGQMVGNRFVAPSFFQYAAPLLQGYVGRKELEKVEQRQLDLAKQLRADEISAMTDYMQQKQGRPAQPAPTGYELIDAGTPAIPANPQAALANLYTNPRATQAQRQFAFQRMNAEPEAFTLPEGSARFVTMPDGTVKKVAEGGDRTRAPVTVGSYLIDPQTGRVIFQAPKEASSKDFGNALSLRKEFNNEGIYKGYQEVKNAWNQINTGLNAKSPAGDLAAATKFMKLLDPGSVVRESELLLAMQASGALDRLYNYANLRVTGQKLNPAQREDFRKLSDEFYQTSLNQYNEKFNEYRDIALRNNLNPDDIGKIDVFKPQTTPKKEEKPKSTVGQQLNVPAVKAPKFLGFEPAPTGQQ